MKTRTKLILGAVALVLIGQHQLGRYLFEQECKTNEGAWVKAIEPANSLAYDRLGTHSDIDKNGCGWNAHSCAGSLIVEDNRRAFVEIYVHKPNAEFLSTERGWYRYWLARRGDPACAAFYAAQTIHANWHAHLADPRAKPRLDPDAVCIASKKIAMPESRYVDWRRNDIEKRMLGLSIWRHDLIDRQTGDIRTHFQRSHYLGPWLYEALVWLGRHFFDGVGDYESCRLPPERYEFPSEAYKGPKSTLGSLSSEGWPMLSAAPHSSK